MPGGFSLPSAKPSKSPVAAFTAQGYKDTTNTANGAQRATENRTEGITKTSREQPTNPTEQRPPPDRV